MTKLMSLTQDEVPSGSKLLYISDVHVPSEHRPAVELVISIAEAVGITHVIACGDIYDAYCISTHAKEAERLLTAGTLREEAARGVYLTRWLSTRPCIFVEGNHEHRINRFIDEHPALYGLTVRDVLGLPADWVVLPNKAQIRLGNLIMAHGDGEFAKGSGGKYPAHKLLDMAPNHSSIVGHLHRRAYAVRTFVDEDGISLNRAVWCNPHLSCDDSHLSYVGRFPGWQHGATVITVYWVNDRPRWEVAPIDVLYDRQGPYAIFNGRLYR